jgi:hypothetical protein
MRAMRSALGTMRNMFVHKRTILISISPKQGVRVWPDSAQDKVQSRAFVNAVINVHVP